jgi:hypothetical protein
MSQGAFSMKKNIAVLVLALIAAGVVFGQEEEQQQEQQQNEGLWATILNARGFAPGVEGARFFITGGIGFEAPFFSLITHNMPPISVSVDYVAFPEMALSLGGKLAFSSLKYKEEAIDDCVNVDIGLRVAIHSKIFETIENLDVSALFLIGFDFATGDSYKAIKDSTLLFTDGFDGFYIGVGLGGRYFFTETIGAFLEVDVKVIMKNSVGASLGLALKF